MEPQPATSSIETPSEQTITHPSAPGDDVQQVQGMHSSGSSGSSPRSPWKRRLIRCGVAAIQALLLLELAATVVQPLVNRRDDTTSCNNSDDDDDEFDPADVLCDYLKGKTGLTSLQLLTTKQLRQAVNNLVTEDYQELGIKDRGAELREIVDDIIQAREEGPKPRPEPGRVGLGKLGPLRFRNTRRLLGARSTAADGPTEAAGTGAAAAAAATTAGPPPSQST